ncbi:zinc-binding domain-containing protein [Hypoxylon argillaceum]|nr:zinc-binding domain-containing protein [Hypoxylon argillaceum]
MATGTIPIPVSCTPCDRSFGSREALQQHLRDSPAHGLECGICNKSFSSEQSLQQHNRDSPSHAFKCNSCSISFGSNDALKQHLRDSPAHNPVFECDICDRSFGSEEARRQHMRDSPSHTSVLKCHICNRSFSSEEALQQHTRDSPAHGSTPNMLNIFISSNGALQQHLQDPIVFTPSLECDTCEKAFISEDALQQHLQNSKIHKPQINQTESISSFMFPALHSRVVEAVSGQPDNIWFEKKNNDRTSNSHETFVIARFKCNTAACSKDAWSSGKVPIVIRGYPQNGYNAVVFNQRCRYCENLGTMTLNEETYAERIAYRLKVWARVPVPRQTFGVKRSPPHIQELCEGCIQGYCQVQSNSPRQLRPHLA